MGSIGHDGLVAHILRLPRRLLVALDVDGTLAPIVDEPEEARVPPATRRLLRRLIGVPRVEVALVTGRSASTLRKVAGRMDGVWRGLEHGRIILRPGEPVPRRQLDRASRERLQSFERWALEEAIPHGGRLERKGASRVVHVRALSERDPREATRLLRAAEKRARALGLHSRPGRAVLEAEASPGDKGQALDAIRFSSRARGVVYAGDDVTDYPAIRAAVRQGGVGIFVRSPERPRAPRGASAAVAGPEGLADVLAQLVGALEMRR